MTRLFAALVATALSATAVAGPTGVIFHASDGFAGGPSGPASADFVVEREFNNHTVLRATSAIGESDFQWLNIPLTLPVSDDAGRIGAVSICFQTTGGAYISQTRLTEQLLPGPAGVVFDDGTDRMDTAGACYTVQPGHLPGGVVKLSLKVVMPDPANDRIELTGGLVTMTPR
jgi:hypothetical protein